MGLREGRRVGRLRSLFREGRDIPGYAERGEEIGKGGVFFLEI